VHADVIEHVDHGLRLLGITGSGQRGQLREQQERQGEEGNEVTRQPRGMRKGSHRVLCTSRAINTNRSHYLLKCLAFRDSTSHKAKKCVFASPPAASPSPSWAPPTPGARELPPRAMPRPRWAR